MAVLARDGERVERAFPISGASLQIEQSIDAPGKLRIALHRLLGKRLRRGIVVPALGFEEQSAHPEQMGLGLIEHGLEGALCRSLVALELRGLRSEQPGQRLTREIARGHGGVTLRERAVADADGEKAAGERVIALPLAALPRVSRDGGGTREEIAQQAP
jgi:hypothetical protein